MWLWTWIVHTVQIWYCKKKMLNSFGFFQHDNAQPHTAAVIQAYLERNNIEVCLTHQTDRTWYRVIIGYFWRLRKPFGIGTSIPTMKSSMQLTPFSSAYLKKTSRRWSTSSGQRGWRVVWGSETSTLRKRPPLVVIVKVMLAIITAFIYWGNYRKLQSTL